MRQRPGAIQRTREGLSEGTVSTREGWERVGPRCPKRRDGMALGAAESKSTVAQRELCTCGSQSRQAGSSVSMQQGIQAREDGGIMSSGVCSCVCRWQCAQRVLRTRGRTERQQQPCNLSVGKE